MVLLDLGKYRGVTVPVKSGEERALEARLQRLQLAGKDVEAELNRILEEIDKTIEKLIARNPEKYKYIRTVKTRRKERYVW